MELGQFITYFMSSVVYQSVTYPPYGTFTKAPPFDNNLHLLPQPPEELQTKFYVSTRNEHDVIVKPMQQRLPSLQYKTHVTVIIHGFLENGNFSWVQMMSKQLLQHKDMMVVAVDYENGAAFPYFRAIGDARLVGKQISHFVQRLHDTKITENIHLIGFSLGSHVAAYASEDLKAKGVPVHRVTGLDPASPEFENKDVRRRLDPNDAQFVDVIHSDTESFASLALGAHQRMGHVDFYPNGGKHQPGCPEKEMGMITSHDSMKKYACSHYRAVYFFIESINNLHAFKSRKCQDYQHFKRKHCQPCTSKGGCNMMGYHATKVNKHGGNNDGVSYYLKTNSRYPFSRS